MGGSVGGHLQSDRYGVEVPLTHAQQHRSIAAQPVLIAISRCEASVTLHAGLPAGGQIFHGVSVRIEPKVTYIRALPGRFAEP